MFTMYNLLSKQPNRISKLPTEVLVYIHTLPKKELCESIRQFDRSTLRRPVPLLRRQNGEREPVDYSDIDDPPFIL